MSNPTELPDLDREKLRVHAFRIFEQRHWVTDEALDGLVSYIEDVASARRAQPEGEAPQAIGKEWCERMATREIEADVNIEAGAPAATLSPLCGAQQNLELVVARLEQIVEGCDNASERAEEALICMRAALGAQHADSGKEAFSDWEIGLEDADGNPLATVRQDELSAAADFIASAALASVRIDGKDFRREDFVAFLKSRRGQSALAAQQAAAPAVQKVQASTTRVTETKRAQLEARGYEVVGYVMQNSVNELCTLAHGRVEWLGKGSAPGTPKAPTDILSCWSCGKMYALSQRAEADGNCPHCGAEIELQRAAQLDGGQEGSE